MGSSDYVVPWYAEILHSFPHVDLTFRHVNASFDPQEPRYRESLVFWAAIPVLWLLVTLLIFLIYFCYRCCQKEVHEKRKKATCLKWTMAILALLTCASVGAGFYGNEEANKGGVQFAKAAEDADDTISHMKREVLELEKNINYTIEQGVEELQAIFRNHPRVNRTLQKDLQQITTQSLRHAQHILQDVSVINSKADQIDISDAVYYTKEYGFYRWLGLLLLMIWEVLLCLLVLLAIGKSSKCTLLMFCAFGIFTLVLCWICAGVHLGISIGVSDFCVEPEYFFENLSSEKVEKDVLRYYLMCNQEVSNPFSKALKNALDSVTTANTTMNKAISLADKVIERAEIAPYVSQVWLGFDKTVENIQQLTALVQCTNLHKDYSNAIEGVCHMALPGVVFLLLSSVVTGLFLTLLVLLASCAWRHIGKKKGYYVVDDEEPRLAMPDNSSPTYYSFGSSRARQGNPREHVPMHRRGSPPPAYNTNEFYPGQYPNETPPGTGRGDISGESNA